MDSYTEECLEKDDEKLYALLEKAMSEEPRLTVSEELIQKTLRRAEEESTQVRENKKSWKGLYRFVGYGCAAAAAVLVLVIGGKGFMGRKAEDKSEGMADSGVKYMAGFSGNGNSMVKGADNVADENEIGFQSVKEDLVGDRAFTAAEIFQNSVDGFLDADDMKPEASESIDREAVVTLSEAFISAVAEYGYVIYDKEALFVSGGSEKERSVQELMNETVKKLACKKVQMPEDRTLFLDEDGKLMAGGGLRFGVYAETEAGGLWILLGDEVYLLEE